MGTKSEQRKGFLCSFLVHRSLQWVWMKSGEGWGNSSSMVVHQMNERNNKSSIFLHFLMNLFMFESRLGSFNLCLTFLQQARSIFQPRSNWDQETNCNSPFLQHLKIGPFVLSCIFLVDADCFALPIFITKVKNKEINREHNG